MLLILDGNSDIGAHVRSNLCYMIFVRHFIRSRAIINAIFFYLNHFFLHARAICSELPSDLRTMVGEETCSSDFHEQRILHRITESGLARFSTEIVLCSKHILTLCVLEGGGGYLIPATHKLVKAIPYILSIVQCSFFSKMNFHLSSQVDFFMVCQEWNRVGIGLL